MDNGSDHRGATDRRRSTTQSRYTVDNSSSQVGRHVADDVVSRRRRVSTVDDRLRRTLRHSDVYGSQTQSSYKSWLFAVVLVLTLTLPCSILVVCTVVIIFFLARSQHFRTTVSRTLVCYVGRLCNVVELKGVQVEFGPPKSI